MAGGTGAGGGTDSPGAAAPGGLLDRDEAGALEIVNAEAGGSAILVCDHASNRMPRRLGTLGLGPAALQSHIAWDPGAAVVARRLSQLLHAPLVLSGYSRLVIDCNRPLDSPESIPERTGGVMVPGNRPLTPEDRARRIDTLFTPYHQAIGKVIDSRMGRPVLLLSIHSFTPVFGGQRRPWSVGFSYGRDARLAALMIDAMNRDGNVLVGDNQPYSVDDSTDYTIPVHGEARGLPNVLIELRQDVISTGADATAWARRLAEVLRQIETTALCLR